MAREREQFFREITFEIRDTSEEGDGRSFSGYAAVFDSPATISERGQTFTETIRAGAFRRTLTDRGRVRGSAGCVHAVLWCNGSGARSHDSGTRT